MTEQASSQKSLSEQILDDMLTKIAVRKEFDREVVGQLRRVANSGGLTKAPRVVKAIKWSEGAGDETP